MWKTRKMPHGKLQENGGGRQWEVRVGSPAPDISISTCLYFSGPSTLLAPGEPWKSMMFKHILSSESSRNGSRLGQFELA